MAARQKAIVVVMWDICWQSVAFSEIVNDYAKSNPGDLPFSVVCIAAGGSMLAAANREGSISYQLAQQSKRYQASVRSMTEERGGKQSITTLIGRWNVEDFPPGCTHYIIVE